MILYPTWLSILIISFDAVALIIFGLWVAGVII